MILEHKNLPMSFDIYQSQEDNVWVIHVDTDGMPENKKGPIIKIYLNDGEIFENPEHPGRI